MEPTNDPIAPDFDEGVGPIDEPYYGFNATEHVGYPLNGSFSSGFAWGRF